VGWRDKGEVEMGERHRERRILGGGERERKKGWE
jgi:hypothetical protein